MSLPIRNEPVTIGDQLIRRHAAVNRRIASVADRLFQLAYAVAYRMLRVWWFVRRPKHRRRNRSVRGNSVRRRRSGKEVFSFGARPEQGGFAAIS